MLNFDDIMNDTQSPGVVSLTRALVGGGTDTQKLYNLQAVNTYLASIRTQLASLEAAGAWIGTVLTVEDLPDNVSAFNGKEGLLDVKPSASDFVNVQNATFWKNSTTGATTVEDQTGEPGWSKVSGPARFVIILEADGGCSWKFDFGLNVEVTGKADKIAGTSSDELVVFNGVDGNITSSGVQIDDLVKTTGGQSIGGQKTFTSTVLVPDVDENSDDNAAATKAYVDAKVVAASGMDWEFEALS